MLKGTYSGTVYVFASDAEMAEALGIENPNGPSSIKIATAVMKLDSAKTVKAKNGDGSGFLAAARLITLYWRTERAQVLGRRTTANMLAFPPFACLAF